ncbi:restriction endonuclease subunit S [Enterococcus faecalis]|nr:restriction endonuclease subunit S [Enterococcus faecalis]
MIVFTLIGVWELCKLGEVATMNARIGWQNLRTSEFLDSGDYMLITGTDFKDGRIDYSSIHYVEKNRFDQDKKIQIQNDSILITKDGTLGKVAYVEGLTTPATLNAGVFNVRVKNISKVDSRYLFHYLKAPFLLKYADAQSTGGTIKHLNQNVLVNFPIPLPIKEEQQIIGLFLKKFDDAITLHQRKLDQLKELKKAYLQLMFPTKDEIVPRMRFVDFEGEWELCKLENIIEKQIKGKAKVENLCNGSVEYLDANRLNGGKPIYTKALPDVSERDIIILWDGSKAGKVYYGFKGVLGSTLKAYQLKECANSQFIYQQLLDNQNNIYNNYRTPNIPHVVKNFSSIFPIWMTSFEEQSQMADILSNLDNRIILQQNLIDTMISLKKSYLQNMFI